jgi:hypothetical protein
MGPSVTIVQEAGRFSELVWTQKLEEKSFPSARDRTPVVQSVVGHYADWATPAFLRNLVVNWMTISKWILKKQGVSMWTQLKWLRIGSSGRCVRRWRIYWQAEPLSSSREWLRLMERERGQLSNAPDQLFVAETDQESNPYKSRFPAATRHHATTSCRGVEVKLQTFQLGIGWKWMVSFKLWPFYSQHALNRGLGCSQAVVTKGGNL